MAAPKTYKKKKFKESHTFVIFWLVFFIVIISVFMFNRETIQENFNLFRTGLTTSPGGGEEPLVIENEPVISVTIEYTAQPSSGTSSEGSQTARPQTTEPAIVNQTQETPSTTGRPAETAQDSQPQTQTPVRTIDRTIYFTLIRSDGHVLYSGVTRRMPVTESPMMDTLNAIFAGPSADELRRGIINMVPQQTRILSATIRGSTAYINFSEDFLFNTFGVEGYVAQLRQIVWTVTEFSNIADVQILIEGRRMDYLGEGIWIGSPISRQSF